MLCFLSEVHVNIKLKLSRSWILLKNIEVEFVLKHVLSPKESELFWLSRAMVKQYTCRGIDVRHVENRCSVFY